MPRIPQYVSQEATPSSLPYQMAPLSAAASPLASSGQGLMVAAGSLADIAVGEQRAKEQEAKALAAQLKINNTFQEKEIDLDIADKVGQFKVEYDKRQQELLESGRYPEQVATEMEKFATDYTQALQDNLRYPDSTTQFLTKMQPILTESRIQTAHKTNTIRYAQIEEQDRVLNEVDTNLAVVGATEEQRLAAVQRIDNRAQKGLRAGIYSGDKAAAMKLGAAKDIQKGEASRDFDDPAQAASVIDRLNKGQYPYIGGLAEQRAFGFTLMERQYTITQREEKVAEETWKRVQGQEYSRVLQKAWDGTLTRSERDQFFQQWTAEPGQINKINELLAREPNAREAASDPTVRDQVMVGTHTRTPTMTQATLDGLRQAYLSGRPGLNFQDWKEATDQLRMRGDKREDDYKYGHSIAGQRQAQAEQLLQQSLGLPPGPIPAGVDSTTLRILSQSNRELTNRSNYFSGKEDPLAVANEIVIRSGYQNAIGSNAVRKAEELAGSLPVGQTPEKLDAQFRRDPNNPEYRRQFDTYIRLLELDRQQRIADQESAAAAGKPTPAPSIFQRFFGRTGATAAPTPSPTAPAPPAGGKGATGGRLKPRTGPTD